MSELSYVFTDTDGNFQDGWLHAPAFGVALQLEPCGSDDGILFIAQDFDNDKNYLYRYNNGSWSGPVDTSVAKLFPSNDCIVKAGNRHFLMINQNELYVSEDVGVTWEACVGITGFDMGNEFLSLAGVGDTYYVFTYNGAISYDIYKSTDGGHNWTLVQAITDGDFIEADTLQLAVDPNDANHVAFLGLPNSPDRDSMTIGVSTNGLGSYTKHTIPNSFGVMDTVGNLFEFEIMRFTPDGSRIVVMADIIDDQMSPTWYFGAYYSDDDGATWTEVLNEMPTGADEFGGSDPNLGPLLVYTDGLMFACGNNGQTFTGGGIMVVYFSQDYGETWNILPVVPEDWNTNPSAENSGGRIIYDPSTDTLYAWNMFTTPVVYKMENPTGGSPTWVDITPSGVSNSSGNFPASGQALALA